MGLAGEVEAVGPAVREFAVSDEVFGVKGAGANAEWVCVRESACLAHKPTDLSFHEAAAVCDGGCSALSCLQQAGLREGQKIVIYGAGPGVGDPLDRRQTSENRNRPLQERARSASQGAGRARQVPTGHRPQLPTGAGG